jgi:tRNA pseudouridine38-40 synthase
MRIAMQIEYDGGKFCGSQFQSGVRTVQDELEKALTVYLRSPERRRIHFSGRTDTGVHASGQVVHFDATEEAANDLWRLCWALNGILKNDLSVVRAQVVSDDFHARYKAERRTYAYRILNRRQRSALLRDNHAFIPFPLDVDLMTQTAQALVGEHDFSAFKSTNSDTGTTICRVERAQILNLGEGKLEFWICANHFVYNMVRIIVGTLIEIGLGKRPSTDLVEALTGKERHQAGPTAPPWGLCLESVEYPSKYGLFTADLSGEPQP